MGVNQNRLLGTAKLGQEKKSERNIFGWAGVGLEFGMKNVKCSRRLRGGGSGLSKTCFRDCADQFKKMFLLT